MFSGIEAASVAFGPLGWKAICFAEIEKFPSAVLAHHYPNTPNVGDMSKHDWAQYRGRVDIVCGGPPCQTFSVAGLRGSLDDARGNLSLVYMKALHAIKPRNAIIENVPGWLSTKDNAFGCFLAGLVGASDALPPPDGRRWPSAGMVSGPEGRAAWRILDAQYFGLAQRRKRVIVVADFGNGADPAAVLFEPEGVRRDSPPSREAGQNVTGTIASRTTGGGGLGTDDLDGGLLPVLSRPLLAKDNDSFDETLQTYVPTAFGGNRQSGPIDIATAVNAHGGPHDRLDFESETFLVQSVTGPISHALKAEGADGSEDGTGRGVPVVCVHGTQDPCTSEHVAFAMGRNNGGENVICFPLKKVHGADASLDLAPTLRASGHTSSHANAGVLPAIAFMTRGSNLDTNGEISGTLGTNADRASGGAPCVTVALRGREGGGTAELGDDCAFALRASSGGGGDKPHVLQSAVSFTASSQSNSYAWEREIYPTLNAQIPNDTSNIQYGVRIGSAVRRLTPRECERLQGFQFRVHSTYPGAWQDTSGRFWSPDYTAIPWRGKPASLCPDGPRYKSLGNSWAVPKFRWLGERIAAFMPVSLQPCPVPLPAN